MDRLSQARTSLAKPSLHTTPPERWHATTLKPSQHFFPATLLSTIFIFCQTNNEVTPDVGCSPAAAWLPWYPGCLSPPPPTSPWRTCRTACSATQQTPGRGSVLQWGNLCWTSLASRICSPDPCWQQNKRCTATNSSSLTVTGRCSAPPTSTP